METQQEDNSLIFIAEQYSQVTFTSIKCRLQTYMYLHGTKIKPLDASKSGNRVTIKDTYQLDGTIVNFTLDLIPRQETTFLDRLEVEVLSDDERTTSALVTK